MASKQLKFLRNYERSCERFRSVCVRTLTRSACRRAALDAGPGTQGDRWRHCRRAGARAHPRRRVSRPRPHRPPGAPRDARRITSSSPVTPLAAAWRSPSPSRSRPSICPSWSSWSFRSWLEITLANPAILDVERQDPWLSSAGLSVVGRTWAGTTDLDDPEGRRQGSGHRRPSPDLRDGGR